MKKVLRHNIKLRRSHNWKQRSWKIYGCEVITCLILRASHRMKIDQHRPACHHSMWNYEVRDVIFKNIFLGSCNPSSCMLVNHEPSQQSSKEENKPWKWGATARYYTSNTKTMLPTRKSVPRSSRQLDHTKTSCPSQRDAHCSGVVMSPVHQVWPKPSCKAQWKGEEDKADKRRGGKTTSGNGQAWSSAGPRGQWRTGENGENWLRNHLWCPNDPRG